MFYTFRVLALTVWYVAYSPYRSSPNVEEVFAGEGHKMRRFQRVTYPESYITRYTTYTKKIFAGQDWAGQTVLHMAVGVNELMFLYDNGESYNSY